MDDLLDHYAVDARPLPGARRAFWCKRRADDRRVVVKCLVGDYPTTEAIAELRHEFALLTRLVAAPVPRPLGLYRHGNGVALVLDIAPGETVHRILAQGRPNPLRFCELSLRCARTVEAIHAEGIIHRDIKPHHFFVSEEADRALIIDFGLATELSREHQAPIRPDRLEGTLAYISPEQTGRMNRSVDRRSDLYSLGVTLYELASGELPFTGDDALELVHAHIARTPRALSEHRPDLPEVLSEIVMRLLCKLPDERYQSARGLGLDLKRVRDELRRSQAVQSFPLGQDDFDGMLRVPEKLYGRETEARSLISSFQLAKNGGRRLVLISGPAGVGKSALVQELHRELVRGGQFVSGKFDQYNRGIPYSALTTACGELVRAYLASPRSVLEAWKERLRAALGDNASVVMEVVPELQMALGQQTAAASLPPAEAQVRFERSFCRFMQASAGEGSPLVLFLDDLQWADVASLAVLEQVLASAEQTHLLVIANYRDAEVDALHPLARCLERLDGRVPAQRIELGPLSDADVAQLLSDALPLCAEPIGPLASCIANKTSGNPFFVTQFLQRLDADGQLRFEAGRGYCWNLGAIAELHAADNVVDLVVSRIDRLEQETQQLLKLAACIGHEFDLSTLTIIAESSRIAVARALHPAVSEGFVLPVGAQYRVLEDLLEGDGEAQVQARYRFAHDRVQQAAAAKISEGEQSLVHVKIGRLLLDGFGAKGPSDDQLFGVVGHLNLGRLHLIDPDERGAVARLNLRAAERARSAAAYASALDHANACLELLGENAWRDEYAACHAAQMIAAESYYLSGDDTSALLVIDAVEANAKSVLDRVPARNLKTTLLTNQGLLEAAVTLSLETTALLGMPLPSPLDQAALGQAIGEAFGAYQQALGGLEVASLRDLPPMTDAVKLALVQTVAGAIPSAYQFNPNVMVLLTLRTVKLFPEYGSAPLSPFFYAQYGVVHNVVTNDYARGYEFGQLALELSRRPEHAASRGGVRFLCGEFIAPWVRPMAESLAHLEHGATEGLDVGDRMHAHYCIAFAPACRFSMGDPLMEVMHSVPGRVEMLQASGDVITLAYLKSLERAAAALRGETVSLGCFDSADFVEAEFERQVATPVLALYGTYKVMVRYLAGDAEQALRISEELPCMPGLFYLPDHVFYRAMACADLARQAEHERRKELLQKLDSDLASYAAWARSCPENFASRHQLLSAERRVLSGEMLLALDEFERSIELAAAGTALHHSALALERAGRFHHREGRLRLARVCLREASYYYERWGAARKVQQLAKEFPDVPRPQQGAVRGFTSSVTETSASEGGQLDLASAMRATKAMASELRLEPLLRQLMEIVVENAGATRGALVLPQGNELRVRASLTVDPENVEAALDEPLHGSKRLAATIVQYCARSGEAVVLDDAGHDGRFVSDPYVVERGARSIVCLPLLHHGKLVGVLYLENDNVTGAFHEARVKRLEFLGGHAAASLENARLYDQLRAANESLEQRVLVRTAELSQRNADMRRVLDNVAQGLLTLDLRGRLASERSAVVDEWFGPFVGGADFCEYIRASDEHFAEMFSITFEMLLEGFLPPAVAISQMPTTLEHAGRHFGLSYEPIRTDDVLSGLLVVIDDRTEALQRAREEAEQKEELALCRQLTRNRDGLVLFFEEGDPIVECISMDQASHRAMRASLHTLKGNAAMFGFALLARRCHDVEDAIEAGVPIVPLAALVSERWAALKATLRLLAGEDARQRVEIPRQALRELAARIHGGLPPGDVIEELEHLQLEPLSEPLTRLGDYARSLAERLGKGELEVCVRGGELRADADRAASFWAILVHLVRNAVDHGIEPPQQRQEQGKRASGYLELRATCSGSDLCIQIRDDGRGIDWERVYEEAVARGLPATRRADLVRALLVGGTSKREEVTETSGRGVGLSAVLSEVERLGGEMDVESQVGKGCCFIVRVPEQALGVWGPSPHPSRPGREAASLGSQQMD